MKGMGIKFTSVVVRCLLGPLSIFGPMALLELIASPNSPNRGFSLPPVAHLPHYSPYNVPFVILQWF